jgi:hypothetical protein
MKKNLFLQVEEVLKDKLLRLCARDKRTQAAQVSKLIEDADETK